jgi:hypothetical protein
MHIITMLYHILLITNKFRSFLIPPTKLLYTSNVNTINSQTVYVEPLNTLIAASNSPYMDYRGITVGCIHLGSGIQSVPQRLIWRSCDLSNERRLTTGALQSTGSVSDNIVEWAVLSHDILVH